MLQNKKEKRVLVIAGPTGVGESTITHEIIKRYPIFKRLVTATTRNPRLNEKHGKDYYFFSKDKFKDEIKNNNIMYLHIINNIIVYTPQQCNMLDFFSIHEHENSLPPLYT